MIVFIMDNGKMDNRMAMEFKSGRMAIAMREFRKMEKQMEKVSSFILLMNILKGTLSIIKQMDLAYSYKPMGSSMRGNLKIIYNMDKGSKLSLMGLFILELSKMDRNMAKVTINVLIILYIRVNGDIIK